MNTMIYLSCALGIISRTILPFLLELKDKPNTKFDKKFILPAVLGIVVNLLVAPIVFGSIPVGADWIAAYIVGWGSTDISRDALKLVGGNIKALEFLK